MTVHPSIGLLTGKAVIVTGAGRGLGRAMATVFAREGAKVLAVDISGQEAAVADELGPAVVPFNADVSQEDRIEAMFARALEVFGKVDALVNVAGTLASRYPEVTVEEYDQMTAVNLRGVMLCCKHAMRAMVPAGGGAILNISTVGALNAEGRASIAYSAAKAGVHSLTKSFALQYGRQGVRVNAMAPGISITDRIRTSAPPEVIRELSEKAAMGRAGEEEEQAQVAAFLISERASFVTGAIIPVDGGWSARLA